MRVRSCWSSIAVLVLVAAGGCGDDGSEPPVGAEGTVSTDAAPWPEQPSSGGEWTVRIIESIPHDPDAFTQGLEATEYGVVESTGLRGESTIRITDAATGAEVVSRDLEAELFGEGLTRVGNEVVQLTWTAGRALRWDLESLTLVGEHTYDGEGWGLCFDGSELWMSDGSARLVRRDPQTFAVIGAVDVVRDAVPVTRLNELECIDGHVVANVWQTDEIVVIEPTTGVVVATIDASALSAAAGAETSDAALNGIADLGSGRLLLGGKRWPQHFVVELTVSEH